ncbi:TetR/AcrR family transcriptional regulator [Microbacterium sp. P06]|uniref:TetR/AcrR family transcriptional regulator n=1 Tax=unclassified Microbacterium TaxID=2609290 RepID=UPI0037463FA3
MVDTSITSTRRRENTRQRLLDAAAQIFAEVGLDAASVEAVCEAAGYTRGAFYSNFESKEQLFLDLCARTAAQQIAAVRAEVAELETGGLDGPPGDALTVVQQVLEASGADRVAVLLMGEIRIRALRDPSVAAAYRAQEAEMRAEVAQIIVDLARAKRITLRLSPSQAGELFITAWAAAAEDAVMDGGDRTQIKRRISEALAVVAELVIDHQR